MDYTTLAITAALLLLSIVYAYLVHWKYKDFPPGPYGIPLLGYAPFLDANPHVTFKNLVKKYGSIFSVNMGGQQTVVVNDWPSVSEVLTKQSDTFSNRPFIYMFDMITQGKNNDIVTTKGAVRKELKRITMKILKSFGMGRSSLENMVVAQMEKLATHLKTLDGQLVDMHSVLFMPILNVIWGITAGKTFDTNHSEICSFADSIQTLNSLNNVGILNILPFLRFVAPELTGYTKFAKASKTVYDYVERTVDKHFEEHAGQQTDLIHAFIEEMNQRKKDKMDVPPYCKDNLVGAAIDMFVAGTETTVITLHWAFLLMAYYPDIQKKVQRELDEKIAADSYLSYSAKSEIPYTEATLCEIQRVASTVSFAIPHCTSRDATLFGYRIPKETTVIANLWAVHNDEKYWSDPEEFRPERFLDEEGRLKKHDQPIFFSAGPRRCPGESLAILELHLFFSVLMRRFTFEMDPNDLLSSESPLEPIIGLSLRPRCNSLILKCRS